MKKVVFLLVLIISQFTNACHTLIEAQKIALANNKFILVNVMDSKENQDAKFFMLEKENLELLNNYVVLNLYKNKDELEIKQFKIFDYPTILVIDGNGIEIYKYSNVNDLIGFKSALENFKNYPVDLNSDLKNFTKHNNYFSAIRIAQSYLAYSLNADTDFKNDIYKVSDAYINKSKNLIKKRDKLYKEKIQKIEILSFFKHAYQKNFSELKKYLSSNDEKLIFENNIPQLYFLKYIESKYNNTNDLALIENKIKSFGIYDDYHTQADLIFNQTL